MTVYINGKILTMDGNKICESFCTRDGYFVALGTNAEIMNSFDDDVIDLEGKTVVPGFNDAHMHFLNYAIQKKNVQIVNIESIEKLICETQSFINERSIPSGEWIVSRGWNDNLFKEKRLPNRYDLDKISTNHPIVFSRICGHIAVANSKALDLLNITSNSPNPKGGIIDKKHGVPTGILRENALNLVFDKLPPMTVDQIKDTLRTAFYDALRCGITTIQTEDLTHCKSLRNLITAYKELEQRHELPLRFILQLNLNNDDLLNEARALHLKSNVGSNFLKIGPVKLFQDGSLGGRTAAMLEPYNDEPHKGVLIYSQEELDSLVLKAHDYGFQVTIHSICDVACSSVLDSYEKLIYKTNDNNLRPTIVHAQFTNNGLLNKFKNLGVIANVQPAFIMTDYPIVEKAIGKDRAKESYAFNSMIKMNIPVAFSSDAPIESFDVIQGIYAVTNRKDLKGKPEGGFYSEEYMDVFNAIKGYTVGPSFMCFEENFKGKIKEGYLADFVILSHDIISMDIEKIKEVSVISTYVNGERKY